MSIHQGVILKNLIKKNHWRQEDFAKELGISRNYLLVILKEVVIDDKYLDKACQVLEVNKQEFLKDESIISTNHLTPDQMKTEHELRKKVQELEDKLDRAERRIDALLFKDENKPKTRSA